MGTTGSSNATSPSASTNAWRGRSVESRFPCRNENEEFREQRRISGTTEVGGEPRSQGPSPYATVRSEEWWSQRPTAPSLSNLRTPRQESLLTYAAQMTGWQPADGTPFAQHQQQQEHRHNETMELSRIVLQLAMANQQLASAHNATLAHLETLYAEFRKERESRRRTIPHVDVEALDPLDEDALGKRLMSDEEEEEDKEEKTRRRALELRVDRLESLLENSWQNKQARNSRKEEERRLRYRVERLEKLVDLRNDRNEEQSFNEERSLDRVKVPENEVKSEGSKSPVEASGSASMHLEKKNLRKVSEEERNRLEQVANEEIVRLTEEIEKLKADRSEYRSANERLMTNLTEQQRMTVKLSKDYEESKLRYEKVESSLNECRQQYEELMREFDAAKRETKRLLKEIDAFHLEKDTADAKISSLEQDLQKSLLEKEQIKNVESQKTSKLRAQLSEEVSDKKKQIKALEDALDEIQRLKETIKTERKGDENTAAKEDAGVVDTMDDVQENPPADCSTNLEEFKKDLTLKREARQRAIAAVSSEMERLRRELDAEKEAHSETSRVLDLLRSAQSDSQNEVLANVCTNVADGTFRKSRMKEQKPDESEIATKKIEAQRLTSIFKVSDELRNDVRFQIEKVDDLRYQLESEPEQHRYRIRCLADVTQKTREALYIRERKTNELKDFLAQILVRLGDRSFLDIKDDVGVECDRQLENINHLKGLYNERLRVLTELKDTAVKELVDVKQRLEHSLKKSESLEEDFKRAEEKIDVQDTEIANLESQLGLTKADCRDLQNQMSLINGLFSQMLLGATSADMDLDRLTQLLQENHDLISDMAREEGTEAAALPKLLLDLVEQVEGGKGSQKKNEAEDNAEGEAEKREEDLQQEDIAHNLPKVWRVLLELLSCHAAGAPTASVTSSSDPNSCYKSVDTPAGPRLVISVSKTYIRLKELILEKKHLEKEMNRMKQLNVHLECKLGEQEKRLSEVSAELSKTWNIVDRMQAQHQQLHTHEKILRYELQQKRKMLQELKQELEYCREKWESARQKNTNTEIEWRSLRREFAARKALAVHDSLNNSAESGFSDGRGDDTDEEDNAVEGRIRLGPRRRTRKESPRAPTPDTESEQPTDTELSESKTCSSTTLEQRTPTPETEGEPDEIEITETDLKLCPDNLQESLDPLDQALTNVIQNLIRIDESSQKSQSEKPSDINSANVSNETPDTLPSNHETEKNWNSMESWNLSPDTESPKRFLENSTMDSEGNKPPPSVSASKEEFLPIALEDPKKLNENEGEKTKIEEPQPSSVFLIPTVTSTSCTMPIFSIGPFPPPTVAPSFVKSVQFSDPLIVGPSNRFFAPVFGVSTFSSDESSSEESQRKQKQLSRSTESVVDSDNVSVDSCSSVETVKELPVEAPSPTSQCEQLKRETTFTQEEVRVDATAKTRSPEEALAARADRLQRLEEQANWLMKKMNATSRRGSALSTRLEELHEVYGEPPVPPPMPDVLPSRRLRTSLPDLPRQIPESSLSAEAIENAQKSNVEKDESRSES